MQGVLTVSFLLILLLPFILPLFLLLSMSSWTAPLDSACRFDASQEHSAQSFCSELAPQLQVQWPRPVNQVDWALICGSSHGFI